MSGVYTIREGEEFRIGHGLDKRDLEDLRAFAHGNASAFQEHGYRPVLQFGQRGKLHASNYGLSDDAYVHLFGMAGSSPCGAGGPNSSSCSITCGQFGCSVDCDDGTYACCKCILFGSSCECI